MKMEQSSNLPKVNDCYLTAEQMTKPRRFFLIWIVAISSLFSCANKNVAIPSDIIPEKEMKSILQDELLAQSAVANYQYNDSLKYTMKDFTAYILSKHGVTNEKFLASLKFYTAHPEVLKDMYQQIVDEMSRKQSEVANP